MLVYKFCVPSHKPGSEGGTGVLRSRAVAVNSHRQVSLFNNADNPAATLSILEDLISEQSELPVLLADKSVALQKFLLGSLHPLWPWLMAAILAMMGRLQMTKDTSFLFFYKVLRVT